MDNQFEPLSNGEVLSIDESAQILIGHRTFRVGEFAQAVKAQLEEGVSGWSEAQDAWFSEDGIPCEVLRFSANGWQKGKVRINLEFCPEEFEEQPVPSTRDRDIPTPLAIDTLLLSEEEFDREASPVGLEDEPFSMGLEEETFSLDPTDNLASEAPAAMDDELAAAAITDELGQEVPAVIYVEDELTAAIADELGEDVPAAIYVEMDLEVPMGSLTDELEFAQTPTTLDDEFDLGEISDSIEQELELVEAPPTSDDDLLDLGDMPDFGDLSTGSETGLDFGETEPTSAEDFLFEDPPASTESEGPETDALLDDVWQDINQASRQNNQY